MYSPSVAQHKIAKRRLRPRENIAAGRWIASAANNASLSVLTLVVHRARFWPASEAGGEPGGLILEHCEQVGFLEVLLVLHKTRIAGAYYQVHRRSAPSASPASRGSKPGHSSETALSEPRGCR